MIIRDAFMTQASAQPFDSLRELRHTNTSLEATIIQERGDLNESEAQSIYEFVTRVEATGRILVNDDDRDTAQGILNFWASRLISSNSVISDKLRSFTLDLPDEGNENDEIAAMTRELQEAREASQKANEIYKKAGEENKRVIRIILGKMIRVSDNGGRSSGCGLADDDAIFGRFPAARQLLTGLVGTGVVQSNSSTGKGYTISKEILLKEWNLLRNIADQRSRIRDTAVLWKRSGSSSVLLSRGPLMDEVGEYTDQTDAEKEFIQASREQIKSSRNRWIIAVACAAFLVLTIILLGVITKREELRKYSKKLEDKTRALTEKSGELSKSELQLQAKVAELNQALEKQTELTVLAERNLQAANASAIEVKKLTSQKPIVEWQARIGKLSYTQGDMSAYAQPMMYNQGGSFFTGGMAPDTPFTAEGYKDLTGILGEVFISKDKEEYIAPAQAVIRLLLNKGMTVPVPVPQPKIHLPSKTEVRYYDPSIKLDDPASPAALVRSLLVSAGIPLEKILTIQVNDPTAPQNFIQIALAKDAFTRP